MNDSRPIAWSALQKGTSVFSSDGRDLGRVTEVVADEQNDIFSGIAYRSGLLGGERFAPAALVERITENGVHLTASENDSEAFEPYGA